MDFDNGNGGPVDALPPPLPVLKDVVPIKAEPVPAKKKVMHVPMARRGLGTKGQKAQLLTNHFKVNVSNVEGPFFHYSVALFYEDGRPIDGKGVGRKVLDKVHETYGSKIAGKEFAYDGGKSLFTVGSLPRNKLEFTVVLENATSNRNNGSASQENNADKKRLCRAYQSKTFKIELSFGAKIPMQAISQAVRGQEFENSQEALRVLDIILRQHAVRLLAWCKFRFSLAAKITEILVVTVSLCRVLRLGFSLVVDKGDILIKEHVLDFLLTMNHSKEADNPVPRSLSYLVVHIIDTHVDHLEDVVTKLEI
nr:protein argonaute 4 [Tanacetum cinerariifolium]